MAGACTDGTMVVANVTGFGAAGGIGIGGARGGFILEVISVTFREPEFAMGVALSVGANSV